jgi:hypothetical protein
MTETVRTWREDPAVNARIQDAVSMAFRYYEHASPAAVRSETAADGSTCRYLWFDRSAPGGYGWDLFEGVGEDGPAPFRRADLMRVSDEKASAVIAVDDGRTVGFYDGLGDPEDQVLCALERFAQALGPA